MSLDELVFIKRMEVKFKGQLSSVLCLHHFYPDPLLVYQRASAITPSEKRAVCVCVCACVCCVCVCV